MPADHHDHQHSTLGKHVMLLVGEETLYCSHLPMFESPHNFQVLLEVELDRKARGLLEKSRAQVGSNRFQTFNPEDFSITDLVSRDPSKVRNAFKGDLHQDHFERGGMIIASGAVVHIKNVVYFEELRPETPKPADLTYRLFGKRKEVFLSHVITQPPDFDQILSVKIIGLEPTSDERFPTAEITFPGRPNGLHKRIKPGEKLSGQGHIRGAHEILDLQVEVLREIYFEEGELRLPETFEPTQEEKASGFGE